MAECEGRVTSYRGQVKEGEAKRKLGLIAECGLTEHPLPCLHLRRSTAYLLGLLHIIMSFLGLQTCS